MSAVNVLVQSTAVHLITDGSVYQPGGILTGVLQKVRSIPHLNCAAAMRGAYLGFAPIMEEISAAQTSFDSLREQMPRLLQACAGAYAHLLSQCWAGPEFEIIVGGISESDGPSAYLVASHDRYGEPWVTRELTGFIPLPNDETILSGVQAAIAPGTSPDEIDPARDGLAVLEIQRAHPRLSNGDDCLVGAFAQLTSVTAGAISSRIIHRWPDVVGKRIAS